MKKRFLSMILVAALLVSMLPVTAFAAHDSTGKPLDLTGDVYLALYIGGSDFPGEPAEHAVSGYLNLNGTFGSNGFGKFAESAVGSRNGIVSSDKLGLDKRYFIAVAAYSHDLGGATSYVNSDYYAHFGFLLTISS